ncbi:MAG: NAD-dependent epimerase/dehydratase family protein [Proteobacteria bacterium]|nr:NAD-dependent epimerase/dehydratase family protein [Pseudomonadota bacterium]
MNVLITGGAGFIGSHLARRLLRDEYNVTLFDNLNPQIHGERTVDPEKKVAERILGNTSYSSERLKVIIGDVRDESTFTRTLEGQDVVVHLAAETGTGQSMYEVERYEDVNLKGTAILLDYLVNNRNSQVRKLVVASSRSIYGEGKYSCRNCGVVFPGIRRPEKMKAGRFEPECPVCGDNCHSLPTDEMSAIHPSSFYGLTKQLQEQMTLLFAKTLGISGFALRYQNVYGPGQSLNNPYTGILAIFSNQARAGNPINIFEDGEESRDFVYIDDVVEATRLCVRPEATGIEAINVGSGIKTTVREVVQNILKFFGKNSVVSITGAFREGDIRHNTADLSKAYQILDFEPKWKFEEGIQEFLLWASVQNTGNSGYEQSLAEMSAKGLMHGFMDFRGRRPGRSGGAIGAEN